MSADDVEIGWWLIPRLWGHGIATEGALRLRDEAFDRIGLDRIIARVQPGNLASIRVAEKLGMQPTGNATGGRGEPILIYTLLNERSPDE